jgi:altronate dehydratase small subunit
MSLPADTNGAPANCPRCLVLHADDNVAVVLDPVEVGPIAIIGDDAAVTAREPIPAGHKIALRPIVPGGTVVKYGVAIGVAMHPIAAGAWVHTHNCRSELDERSHTLDPHTGAPTDTQYA